MQVGSCRGRRSLGRSASGILSIHTSRSTDGPRTCSRRLGPRSQATNLAPERYASHGSPSMP
eukprot:4342294-Pyramimonas_sp.AAC.1